jgi:hypothetical protein
MLAWVYLLIEERGIAVAASPDRRPGWQKMERAADGGECREQAEV